MICKPCPPGRPFTTGYAGKEGGQWADSHTTSGCKFLPKCVVKGVDKPTYVFGHYWFRDKDKHYVKWTNAATGERAKKVRELFWLHNKLTKGTHPFQGGNVVKCDRASTAYIL